MYHHYQYHQKDLAYLQDNELKWFCHYIDKVVRANRLGCESVVDGMAEAYRRTQSIRKAGKLMGITERSFSRHAKRLGIQLRPPGGANRVRKES